MWYFSADWHLGHANIIKYCRRPFMSYEEEGLLGMADRGTIPARELKISQESTDKMTNAIIDSTNAVVSSNDTLVINGDFCWTPREQRFRIAKMYRDRINCKNVYLIWGNHDDRKSLAPAFTGVYDQYTFTVNGQSIFMSHYPCRSWDKAHHGSWMLYGHVHNLYYLEDNGDLMPYDRQVCTEGFGSVLEELGIRNESGERDTAVQKLLEVVASLKGIDLTLDVGIDNVRPGVPFGTPWSMDDLHDYFGKKMPRWKARSDVFRSLRPASSLKGGNPNADPKF